MFCLLDANNFYVSCERRFNPRLERRAVVVLSNNDGCAIARSDEAKALGIQMGEPYFQIRQRFTEQECIALSANFALYADMSSRLMGEAAALGDRQEVYSVDECFLDMQGIPGDLRRRGWVMRQRILKRLGLPCGIGIGQTKTLAKLANHIAKSAARKPGSYPAELAHVCNLGALPTSTIIELMQATHVSDVWGIGRRLSAQLEAAGVRTAWEFFCVDSRLVRQRWGVMLERTLRELQGQSCLVLEDVPRQKQEIACTRSFGQAVTQLSSLEQAITDFTCRAAEKLRKQGSLAGQIHVFCSTSSHRQGKQYHGAVTVRLPVASQNSLELTAAALKGIATIFKSGYAYARAGIMLLDLQDAYEPIGTIRAAPNMVAPVQQQLSLWSHNDEAQPYDARTDTNKSKAADLMRTLDGINQRFGRGTIQLGSAGTIHQHKDWEMRQQHRSPQYTTSWCDIVRATA